MGLELALLVILIVLNAFFAASEIALVTVNDKKMKLLAEEGNKKAKKIVALLEEPSKFLATTQIGITLAGFLASAFAAESFLVFVLRFFEKIGLVMISDLMTVLALVVITFGLAFVTLLLGELVPKRIAMQKAEPIAMFVITPILFILKCTSPFVALLTVSTNAMVRLVGMDPHAKNEEVTEEEIRMMIDVGEEKGTIQADEKMMIHNVFEFNTKTVSDIMTHRTSILAIPKEATLDEIVQLIEKEKYTRYPVYEGHIDKIVGILHVKDLIKFLQQEKKDTFDLTKIMHEAHFILKSYAIDELFKMMKEKNVHMMIALDEYGGTEGIATIEDIIEEIVGNIFDEYDDEKEREKTMEQLEENVYLVRGTTTVHELNETFGLTLPTEEYDTINGLIMGQFGFNLQAEDETVITVERATFTIIEYNEKRIEKIRIQLKTE